MSVIKIPRFIIGDYWLLLGGITFFILGLNTKHLWEKIVCYFVTTILVLICLPSLFDYSYYNELWLHDKSISNAGNADILDYMPIAVGIIFLILGWQVKSVWQRIGFYLFGIIFMADFIKTLNTNIWYIVGRIVLLSVVLLCFIVSLRKKEYLKDEFWKQPAKGS
jgi:hypothetical protein